MAPAIQAELSHVLPGLKLRLPGGLSTASGWFSLTVWSTHRNFIERLRPKANTDCLKQDSKICCRNKCLSDCCVTEALLRCWLKLFFLNAQKAEICICMTFRFMKLCFCVVLFYKYQSLWNWRWLLRGPWKLNALQLKKTHVNRQNTRKWRTQCHQFDNKLA